MEKKNISRLGFGNDSFEHLFAIKITPVKGVTIRYKNKGAVNGYIKPNAKNGKSSIDF